MKIYLVLILLLLSAKQVSAESCVLEPVPGKSAGDILCMENNGVSKEAFTQFCKMGAFGGIMNMRSVKSCPSNRVAKCEIDLSYTDGSIIKYIYSTIKFSKLLAGAHKKGCDNNELGKGNWTVL